MNDKILTFNNVKKSLGNNHSSKVLVGGCFDVLHIGHIRYLQAAKKEGDVVVVALESDEFIRKNKKREPFHNQKERGELLSALECVDYVILLPFLSAFEDYLSLVESVEPSVIAVTKGDMQMKNKQKQAKKVNSQVKIVISHKQNTSSTDMRKHFK